MGSLNPHQVRHVVATFTHVDGLLQAVERVAREDLSPFSRERPDLSADESRLLLSFVAQARARMLGALDRLAIPRPRATTSARWTVDTTLTFATIALCELNESGLRGYGAVDAETAETLGALAEDLQRIVERGKSLLHEHDPGGLDDRLATLPGVPGELLRAVAAVSTRHAIVELRPFISAAAERASASTFDVGIFGRVSAGKSSLINALVGSAVLPVGATPVTAVPLRVHQGNAGITVTLLDGQQRDISPVELASFATEAGNPQNRLGVRAIEVRVPTVSPGLVLLDTPGVGSLGTSGPAQAYAWLPRCDLGLVLIAAGAAMGREDLALVTGLRHAGIACHVLLSKCDMLTSDELAAALAYVSRELDAMLGPGHGIAVRPVSTLAGRTTELDVLRRDVLAPLAAHHTAHAARALRVRLRRLVAATSAAVDGAATVQPPHLESLSARINAEAEIRRVTQALEGQGTNILHDAADAVAAAWSRGAPAPAAARAVILGPPSKALGDVRAVVDQARRTSDAESLTVGRRLPPLFDPELLDTLPALSPPRFARGALGRTIALRHIEPLAGPLDAALSRFATRLYEWGMGQLTDVRETIAESPEADSHGNDNPEVAQLNALVERLDAD